MLTKDALFVVAYAWIGIILRNYFFCQEVHNWSTIHSPLFAGQDDAASSESVKTANAEISPFALLPMVNSGRFAMVILIIFNKLNRHDRGLVVEDAGEKTIWTRIGKMKYILFDLVRCLLKDLVLNAILHGPTATDGLYSDVKFVVIASLLVNHLVKVPTWYKRQGIIWSLLVIEYQTVLASQLLLILKEGQSPRFAGPLGGYLCFMLLALEVFAPLLAPYLEELLCKGKVDNVSFLLANRQFWLAPAISVPFTLIYSFVSIRTSGDVVLPSVGILELNNITGHTLTNRVWNSVSAIYGQIGLLVMLPYLCEIREEYAKAEHQKKINE